MKKQILIFALIAVLLLSLTGFAAKDVPYVWDNFRGSAVNMAITAAPTPTDPAKTEEKWSTAESLQQGSGWNVNNPAPALLVDNKLITTSGAALVELDTATGAVLRTAEMADVCGTLGNSAPAYGGGMIFMPLQCGKVQAFDAVTLAPLWLSESLGKQCTTGLIYDDGFIFGCTGNSSPGKVFCLKAEDEDKETCQEKAAVWAIYDEQDDKGSYWSTPLVTENAVIYGTDSGFLVSRSRADGALITRLTLPDGKQRSGIAFADGRVYGGTSAGYLFSAAVAADGTLSDLISYKDDAVSSVNSAPLVYHGVVYYGGSKQVLAADAETLETLRTTGNTGFEQPRAGGAVQSSFLLREGEDCVWLYATQNCNPGGLYLVTDTGTEMTAAVLHTPVEGKQNYCLVSPICDENGTIYYRNDSGYFFAVGAVKEPLATVRFQLNPAESALTVTQKDGTAVVPTEKGIYRLAAGEYAYKAEYEGSKAEGSFTVSAEEAAAETEKTVTVKISLPQTPSVPTEVRVSIKVSDHNGKTMFRKTAFTLPAGSTAYDLLLETGLEVSAVSTDFGMYIRAIDGLAEKAMGEGSGWTYTVSGKIPAVSADEWELQDGQYVRWEYVAPNAPQENVPDAPQEEPPKQTVLPYQDTAEHWGKEAIAFVTERKLMNGVSAECFAPNEPLTRGMLAVILHRYDGEQKAADASFEDVAADAWYAQGVFWAAEQGIVQGLGEGRFSPNGNITREQLAVMLYRYAKAVPAKKDLSSFRDADAVSPWAKDAVCWAVEIGILTGRDNGTICPAEQATRAEAAAMLMRFVRWVEAR